ncbi:hypothetical protein ACFW2V_13610 [Streptomyces sp. NPDC058947]|uniref:hypothetical protein n=1 Tax=Streptomyces sp. NPDC058947 TaxID=3346675 RepID=UPI0036A25894
MDKLTKDLASKVVNGLYSGRYTRYAEESAEGDDDFQQWVDVLGELADDHSLDMVIATAEFVEAMDAQVAGHEVQDFVQEHFRASGHSKGDVLKSYAEHEDFNLGRLYDLLEKSGGMDSFNWDDFAESGSSWVTDLFFIEAPATGSNPTIYLFQED